MRCAPCSWSTGWPTQPQRRLEALLAAPQSLFGLFPRYDQTQVARAIDHLRAAFEATSEPFQRARIAFFLGKAYLMQDHETEARTWLRVALEQNVTDYREETQALLVALDTR